MNAHSKGQREFIVLRLAQWQPKIDIVRDFAIRFSDTACSLADVERYDPELSIVDPDLCALYETERKRILSDPELSPFASKTARIFALNQMVAAYLANRQFGDARSVLRQIAEEQGESSERSGSGSAPRAGDADEVVGITRTIVDPVAPAPAE